MNSESCKPVLKLTIKGIGHVPGNFKNRKRAILDRRTGKMRTLTDPKVKTWMGLAARSIASQLSSMFQIIEKGTQTAQARRSLIQSLMPLDDSLFWIELGYVRGRRVKKGEEGAEILIEQL